MGRARGKGSGARKAKKAANDREETKKFFNQGGLGPPPKETRRARAAPAEPKLDQFARKRFDKDDKKHTAVVDAAIAAEDRSLPSDAALEAMTGHQLRKLMARRGVGRDPQDRKEDFIDKLKAHAAGETYKKTPWWYGITDILKAPDEELLKFVKRKGDVIIVKSCCGKVVVYGEDSGLRRRSCIAFSVEEYGLDGATRRARLETFKTLGLRDTKFLEQLQKLT